MTQWKSIFVAKLSTFGSELCFTFEPIEFCRFGRKFRWEYVENGTIKITNVNVVIPVHVETTHVDMKFKKKYAKHGKIGSVKIKVSK